MTRLSVNFVQVLVLVAEKLRFGLVTRVLQHELHGVDLVELLLNFVFVHVDPFDHISRVVATQTGVYQLGLMVHIGRGLHR